MCNYTQREYSCGHFRWLASEHCAQYKRRVRQARSTCSPDITSFEKRTVICGECRMKQDSPQLPYGLGRVILGLSRP